MKLSSAPRSQSMQIEQTIKDRLTLAFQPVSLQVINDSHRHAGHASSPGTGESHFSVKVVAPAFAGKSRVERHRMVNAALADLLQGKVHALAIQALAPGEQG